HDNVNNESLTPPQGGRCYDQAPQESCFSVSMALGFVLVCFWQEPEASRKLKVSRNKNGFKDDTAEKQFFL
ncbi:MAG: hypothetical protein R6V54_01480, partial [Desulfobacteraceae bacterium]